MHMLDSAECASVESLCRLDTFVPVQRMGIAEFPVSASKESRHRSGLLQPLRFLHTWRRYHQSSSRSNHYPLRKIIAHVPLHFAKFPSKLRLLCACVSMVQCHPGSAMHICLPRSLGKVSCIMQLWCHFPWAQPWRQHSPCCSAL